MKVDVLIVGGGLAGLALASALRRSGLSLALVEAGAPRLVDGWDARIYAISPANARFLDAIGAWGHLDRARIEPVRCMEILGDGDGRLSFSAYDSGIETLAWIVESSAMLRELWETAKRQGNLELLCPARPRRLEFAAEAANLELEDGRRIAARLVVGADGADSWTRTAAGIEVRFEAYEQLGVVANFAAERPHRGTASQWFLGAQGVLAWLPLPGNRISMVWSAPNALAEELLALDPTALCERVAQAGERRLGKLAPLTLAAGFPLRLMRAPRAVAHRLALIGDAAHTIHPLSGHGINLGYQDARVLGELIAAKPNHVDCGDIGLLRTYERARREEVLTLQTVTDGLHGMFGSTAEPLVRLRNLGLNFTNHLPVVKDLLVRYAIST